jgi:glucans biosynthesis protein
MISSSLFRPSRRHFLKAAAFAAALLTTTSLTGYGLAQEAETGPFDFDSFTERMQALAQTAYEPALPPLPEVYAGLNYDGYRMVQFDVRRAKWAEDGLGYQVQAFPRGWLYKEPVAVSEIVDGDAHAIGFATDDFRVFDEGIRAKAEAEPFPGVAGFRINYPLNKPENADELVSFLGASYFRALGRDNIYGVSARGLLINSWRDGPEEFPRFSEFYLEKPASADQPLTIYAALESQSATGAYRFVITPAGPDRQETVMEVTARLFFRADVAELGVAPLTSMFLFAETNRSSFDDYRPQVHDSNGLILVKESGETMWRALSNAPTLGNTYLWDSNPKAFGLYQRDRNFETYQDAGAHYERRPSLRVEPVDGFGQGTVRLIEIPSKLEADDNIVAFWIPAETVKAGEAREFHYRLIWGDLLPQSDSPLAYVAETRAGQGGISGVENAASLRKFVVDFKGGELEAMEPDAALEVKAEASAGKITSTTLSKVAANDVWRLVLDVETDGAPLIELKASVAADGRPITETWLYQWRGAAA